MPTMQRSLSVSGLTLIIAGTAHADLPALNDINFARLVATVMTVDHLKPLCRDASVQRDVSAWEAANGAASIRAAVEQLRTAPATSAAIANAARDIATGMASASTTPCQNLSEMIGMKDSQFARTQPRLLEQIAEASGAPASPAPAAVGTAAKSGAKRPAELDARAREIASKIEGFAFDFIAMPGIGGGMTMKVFPVVLFKDGQALEDIEALSFAAGLEAHKRANPDDWSKWRREAGRVQTQTGKGWKNLPFKPVYEKLPDGFRLNGRYQSLSGGGNTAYGGSDYVAAWSTFDFLSDGRVVKGGGAGGYSAFQSASTAFSSVSPDRRGRYRVQGLTLEINYEDGSSERYLIVADPTEPDGAIWLDGTGYTMKR